MEKIYIDRFNKLIEHLRTGKLGHKIFDFTCFNWGSDEPYTCGTNGCAIGEMPIVEKEWIFDVDRLPVLRKWSLAEVGRFDVGQECEIPRTFNSIKEWFDITEEEANMLFLPYPDYAIASIYGIKRHGCSATRFEVANNLEIFVAFKAIQF